MSYLFGHTLEMITLYSILLSWFACMSLTLLVYIFLIAQRQLSRGASQQAQYKISARNEGDAGSIPGSGRISGEGYGNPFQYSC